MYVTFACRRLQIHSVPWPGVLSCVLVSLCTGPQRFLPRISHLTVAVRAACFACPVIQNAALFPACAAGKLPGSWAFQFLEVKTMGTLSILTGCCDMQGASMAS